MSDPKVEKYFAKPSERREVTESLRDVLLDCGLEESLKWGKPCYSAEGNNIAIIQEMKAFVALMFFKGALLKNDHGFLEEQGKNTRSAMRLCFTSVDEVGQRARVIRDCVTQAIEVERAGLSVPKNPELELAEELRARLESDATLKEAFESLTPGRQREYNLYFSGAKKAETRVNRVEKCVEKILDGKGLRE
ncbi:MAG: YdeI/OmpD-associated family protein [Myxococcales bacterium]|nr:YdeI/OmpD-associated family protein [Myxococcales bacterium]